MKLQIKTQTKKTLVVDIDVAETVFQLKRELAMYPDIDAEPELQKLTCGSIILDDDEALSNYKLDGRKFINIEVLKTPLPKISKPIPKETEQPPEVIEEVSIVDAKASGDEVNVPDGSSPNSSRVDTKVEELVTNISSMGYPEDEVRRALNASFNNPERAVQYLIDGIPTGSSNYADGGAPYTDTDQSMDAMDIFLRDGRFVLLRQRLHHNSDYLAKFITKLGDDDPDMLSLISDNQSAFFRMLVEEQTMDGSDCEEGVEEIEEFVGDLNEEDLIEYDKATKIEPKTEDERKGDVAS